MEIGDYMINENIFKKKSKKKMKVDPTILNQINEEVKKEKQKKKNDEVL